MIREAAGMRSVMAARFKAKLTFPNGMSPSLTVKAPCGVFTDNSEASVSPSSHTMTPLATIGRGACAWAAPPNSRIGCVEMRH